MKRNMYRKIVGVVLLAGFISGSYVLYRQQILVRKIQKLQTESVVLPLSSEISNASGALEARVEALTEAVGNLQLEMRKLQEGMNVLLKAKESGLEIPRQRTRTIQHSINPEQKRPFSTSSRVL